MGQQVRHSWVRMMGLIQGTPVDQTPFAGPGSCNALGKCLLDSHHTPPLLYLPRRTSYEPAQAVGQSSTPQPLAAHLIRTASANLHVACSRPESHLYPGRTVSASPASLGLWRLAYV